MSTRATHAPSRRAAARRPQWRRATSWFLAVHLYLAVWFWAVAVVVVGVALVVIDRVGTVQISIMQFAYQGAIWFPFATTILFTTAHIGVHVANGLTRRAFIRGALLSTTVSALVYALATSLAMLAEEALFGQLGWSHVPGDVDHDAWTHGVGATLLDGFLVFLAAQVSGLLVGITYYRLGGWWATLLLPLTVGWLVLVVIRADIVGGAWAAFGLEVSTSPAALGAGCLALTALAAYAFYRLARDVPIRRVAA